MVSITTSGPVMRVTLQRPEIRNALNDTVIAELFDVFSNLDPAIRVVILGGEGSVFCAGGDLEWMKRASGYNREENVADAMRLAGMFAAIARCRALVIAIVQGAAFGGGSGMVAAADVAIAVEGTKFCFSEAKLGLIPATISTFVVPKIGVSHARRYFSTAEVFGPDRAKEIGLVHEIAGSMEEAEAMAQRITASVLTCGPEAVFEAKTIAQDAPIPMEEAAARLAEVRAGAEGKEGVAAFLEKRKANFVVEEF